MPLLSCSYIYCRFFAELSEPRAKTHGESEDEQQRLGLNWFKNNVRLLYSALHSLKVLYNNLWGLSQTAFIGANGSRAVHNLVCHSL